MTSSIRPSSCRTRTTMTEVPDLQHSRLNILALDGGGIRGYSELLILDHIMKQLKRAAKLETVPLPCEVFDLICGTSTGGLIALMLGRLRMSVEDALKCYEEFSQTIFGCKWPFRPIRSTWAYIGLLWGRPIYSAQGLEKCIKGVVARFDGDPDAPLQDPLAGDDKKKICRTFVVAIPNAAPLEPRRISTYGTSRRDADRCKVWEAARATTAASTYFKPIRIGTPAQTYIDGGLSGANNPSKLAIDEIKEAFEDRQICCFLSLGTGVPQIRKFGTHAVSVAKSVINVCTNCAGVDDDVYREFQEKEKRGETLGDAYFRFSVDNGMGTIRLDEWRRFGDLASFTDAYMKRPRQSKAVDKCVEKLRPRAEMERQAVVVNNLPQKVARPLLWCVFFLVSFLFSEGFCQKEDTESQPFPFRV